MDGAGIIGVVLFGAGGRAEPADPVAAGHVGAGPERAAVETGDRAVDRWVAQIETYWALELVTVAGATFTPVVDVTGYSTADPTTLPVCNAKVFPAASYAGNAFYCAIEDRIVYDADGLVARLRTETGELSVGVVLAHEYGHAVQHRLGLDIVGPFAERQADCFAGAWAAQLGTQLGTDRPSVADWRGVAASYASVGAATTTTTARPATHGSADDRLAAFLIGRSTGAAGCLHLHDADAAQPLILDEETAGRVALSWLSGGA